MNKLMVILILVALLSGCLNEERTYYQEKKPENALTLHKDGTYTMVSEGYVWAGKYQEDEEKVILIFEPPLPSIIMKKQGQNLTDPDGTLNIRK